MNLNNFIFSNQWLVRFIRHLVFWLTSWFFYLFTYWFPTHWFPGWRPQGKLLTLVQTDAVQFCYFVLSRSFPGLLNIMIFTYIFVYVLAPLFLWKEKYRSFIALTLLLLAIIIIYQYFKLLAVFQATVQAYDPHVVTAVADKSYLLRCAWENILFNCPATGGIALGIKLLKRWYLKQNETQQMALAKTSAELQLLKAQVHPHFLFNTLNNIYSFTLNASSKAPEMIKKLSGLLHYIIYDCQLEKLMLEKELAMIQDYISLERIRYGEHLDISVTIRGDIKNTRIAPLLLLPFVENCFKHGTSKMLSQSWVNLDVILEDQKLYFTLANSKPQQYLVNLQNGGIGLRNVQKRLQLLYPSMHELNMTMEEGHFSVYLEMDLHLSNKQFFEKSTSKKEPIYKMA